MKTYETYSNGHGHEKGKAQRGPSEIEHDVSAIRSEIAETLAAIQAKFSPGELVSQALTGARGMGRGPADFVGNLGRAVRDNPLPAALLGAGLILLLKDDHGPRDESPSADSPGDKAKGIFGHARERAAASVSSLAREHGTSKPDGSSSGSSSKRDAAKDALGSVRERASEAVGSAREGLHHQSDRLREASAEVSHRAREQAARTKDAARSAFEEQPLVLGAIGIAVGAAIGALLPRSRIEDRTLGAKSDRLKGQLAEAARSQLGQAQEVAGRAVSAMKEKAQGALGESHAAGASDPQQERSMAERPERPAAPERTGEMSDARMEVAHSGDVGPDASGLYAAQVPSAPVPGIERWEAAEPPAAQTVATDAEAPYPIDADFDGGVRRR